METAHGRRSDTGSPSHCCSTRCRRASLKAPSREEVVRRGATFAPHKGFLGWVKGGRSWRSALPGLRRNWHWEEWTRLHKTRGTQHLFARAHAGGCLGAHDGRGLAGRARQAGMRRDVAGCFTASLPFRRTSASAPFVIGHRPKGDS